MPRALFEKTGNAVYISHLDLMRLFQRAFKRSGLSLTHTKGFNPRPSVSIALPLSLGTESHCELLDFDLEGEAIAGDAIAERLNTALVEGVRILHVYDNGNRLKNLVFLDCMLTLEYDQGIPALAEEKITSLFSRKEVLVEKKGKSGVVDQDIIPMIRKLSVVALNQQELRVNARICCQNPSLNPMQISVAIAKYLPELTPDFVRCSRVEVYDGNENVFR